MDMKERLYVKVRIFYFLSFFSLENSFPFFFVFLQDDEVNIKWNKKKPRTKSSNWNAIVLAVGHEDFCYEHMQEASVQIKDAEDNQSFQHLVHVVVDPDLTVYEDVGQILLNQNNLPNGARRKLEMAASQNGTNENDNQECSFVAAGTEGSPSGQRFFLLEPEDVSRTLSKIACNQQIEEPNCSAIGGNKVEISLIFFQSNSFLIQLFVELWRTSGVKQSKEQCKDSFLNSRKR